MPKKTMKKYFYNFYWFYSYLKYKIFAGILLSILIGLLDGFGLTMFLPLLQMVDSNSNASMQQIEGISFLTDFIEAFGLNLSLGVVLLFMLFFFVMKGLVRYWSLVYRVTLQQKLIKKIRMDLLNALNKVSFKYFVSSDVGRIQNTFTGEVDRIQNAYLSYFTALEQFILVIVYMSFAFIVDLQFAILVSLGGVLTNFIYGQIYNLTKQASNQFTDDSNIFQGNVIQHVANFKYLRATGMTENYTLRLIQVIKRIEDSRKRMAILSSFLEASREPLLICVIASVIFIQINIFQASLGPILIALLFFYRALTVITGVQNSWNKFLGVSGSLNNFQDFHKNLLENSENLGEGEFVSFCSDIQLTRISFTYGDAYIIKDITLNIKKNESIAFVGESGCGKTTLINLICGLLPPSKGEIFVDGKSSEVLGLSAFQKRIGYVTQEPVIFNDTIFNNITFWAEPTPENKERCIRALRKASAYQFVKQNPLGLDATLGNNGINLSGGQKQRISIARELYKDIDILILDEATSGLDSETESVIQENIDTLKGQYTILIVAHRLSTIKNADTIVLMDNGSILEQDSYDILVQSSMRFRKMLELQGV